MNKEEIMKLLRSGKFTFVFNDSYYGDLIPKKVDSYEEYNNYIEKKTSKSREIEMGNYGDGLVELLIEALGGNIQST